MPGYGPPMYPIASERVIVESPTSLTGSARRIWRLSTNPAVRTLVLAPTIVLAWAFVLVWYVLVAWFIIPFRLIRRSQRKNRRDNLRHQELLGVHSQAPTAPTPTTPAHQRAR